METIISNPQTEEESREVHVLGISGGKDSAALAVYMRDRQPDMHYYFCDTGEELEETYEYLAVLETFLGKPIKRLNPDRDFNHYLKIYNGYLPSPRMRWCTAMLKLKPFEDWLEKDFAGCQVKSYVAIRADEDRDGYISHNPRIETVYPFKDGGIGKDDVFRILEDAGTGLPKYYEWRTRSGCYFCFFQRKAEWAGLKERHPDLYEKAKTYEKFDEATGKQYTWSQSESLIQLEQPERLAQIKLAHAKTLAAEQSRHKSARLSEIFEDALDEEDDSEPCMICNL
jgi:3'-phosphoadenosine 5'-phosphosulfate sulfotransferase (PAPS reductase)/FAD synthetase